MHGTIGLSRVEAAVLDTASFQRLRGVKQLGLANVVFPGADYSRFSHGVGACHLTGRMMTTILRRRGPIGEDEQDEIQRYRLAGLLHDIGHYPFSHAMQDAVMDYAASREKNALRHEDVGGLILREDAELRQAITGGGVDAASVASIFNRSVPLKLANLVSSDLDADRMDYLLRTSHFTGLPYGSIDVDYIVSQLCEDEDGLACVLSRALRAADDLLVSRIFDYQQVAFHKAVAGLEWLLKDVVTALLGLKNTDLNLTEAGVSKSIRNGKWRFLTDANIIERIHGEMRGKRKFGDEVVSRKAEALLSRRIPSVVAQTQHFERLVEPGATDTHALAEQSVRQKIADWADHFGIDRALWHVWAKRINLTKLGAHIQVSSAYTPKNNDDKDRYEQMVRIADKPGGSSRLIVNVRQSLTSILGDYNAEAIRVYVLLEPGQKSLRKEIAGRVRSDLPSIGWIDE